MSPSMTTDESVVDNRFKSFKFDMSGKVFIVTGAGGSNRNLGLCMAEGLAEAGGIVHCFDKYDNPDEAFGHSQKRIDPKFGGELIYHKVNVTVPNEVEKTIADVAAQKRRLDGLIAAAGIQNAKPVLEYSDEDVNKMFAVNYKGVLFSAQACARQMIEYKTRGSICLIASMSGSIANRGFKAAIYNSSKAAVVQLARSLAMEFGRKEDGGIRVNSLSPGHIRTPMVQENFDRGEATEKTWAENSMLGRISEPDEFKAVGLFLLSDASGFMTGSDLVVDGGTTAW